MTRKRKHNERFRGREEITVFGRRAVMEAFEAPSVEVEKAMVARSVPAGFRAELERACEARGVSLRVASEGDVSDASGDARNDQGVVARITLKSVVDVEQFGLKESTPRRSRVLALDGVTNPQNVGMIVRSAVAAGVDGLLWPLAGTPWVSGLIIKSSAASVYRCPIVRCASLVEGLILLKERGYRLIGLEMEGGASVFESRAPERCVFVVGRETEGLSAEVRALLDDRVYIPMKGGVESLNAAVAASIVCFVMGADATLR